jgi:AraC-like DNA-binding protein
MPAEHLPEGLGRLLASGGLPGLSLAMTVAVERSCGRHSHPGAEIVLHHRSQGRTWIDDGRAVDFAAGDVVIYGPGIHHAQRIDRPGEDLCLILDLPAKGFPPLLHVRAPLGSVVEDELRTLIREHAANPDPLRLLASRHRATGLLLGLLATAAAQASDAGQDPAQRLVAQAMAVMQDRFRNLGRMQRLAAELGVSPRRLRQAFQAVLGESPLTTLTRIRVERAKDLLRGTPLGLDAIAAACGWAGAHQLCAVFRRAVGATPASFRRRVA